LASSSNDTLVRIWDLQAGQPDRESFRGRLDAVNSVRFSPNGEKIVSGGEDGTIRLWNLLGQPQRLFQIYGPQVTSVTFTPDGQKIISSDSTGRILLWDLQDPVEKLPLAEWNTTPFGGVRLPMSILLPCSLPPAPQTGIFQRERSKQSSINSISLSSDGKLLRSVGSDGSVKLWQIQKSEELIQQGCNWVSNYLGSGIRVVMRATAL
jgi:WD40 repeat protein